MTYVKFAIILLITISFKICFSQPQIEWEKKICIENYDSYCFSIIQARDSGYILTGSSGQSFDDNDIVIIKLNSRGNLIWEKTYGAYNADRGNSIMQLKDNGFIVTGFTRSKGNGENIWVFKIDEKGDMLWEKTFGIGGWNEGMVVKSSLTDDIIVSGIMTSSKYNTQNVFLTKINSNGNVIWEKFYEKSEIELVQDLVIDENENIFVIGIQNIFKSKIFLKKIDKNGLLINEHYYSISENNFGWKGLLTDKGLIILCGIKKHGDDLMVIEVDLNGDLIWNKIIGTNKYDHPSGIIELSNKQYILAGSTKYKGYGSYDGWLVKIDSIGNKIWEMNLGGKKIDTFQSIAKTYDNGFIIAGQTSSGSTCKKDIWIIKFKE